tara:strand:+ start:103 stop:609 length:507 start_codon:yes stop_codon:yes gene_type:complete
MSNTIYSADQISTKTTECANWIDRITKNSDVVLVPILQSSFMFATDVCKRLQSAPALDFCGIMRYESDGSPEDLYMYKGVDMATYNNKTIVIMDVLCSTGSTMNFVSKFLLQWGAKKVYTAALLTRQFSTHKPNWTGYTISDESIIGYGIDKNYKHRTLNYIAHEQEN